MELLNFALSTTTKMMNVVNDAGGVTTSSIIIQSSTVGGSLSGNGTNAISSTTTTSNVTNINGTVPDDSCPEMEKHRYPSIIGIDLAIPQWEAILVTITLTFIILLTIIGNTLVILSVFTYKPLRIVQNFFIVSLAVADLTVAILVLPFNVLYIILGRWVFSIHLCKMWLTSDVLCCTSSILNLCAIALDRYWAITDPINYAQKRTLERVLYLIAGVWILSLIISSPPLIGWNDWPDVFESDTPCTLNSNPGYRIYSALGSFFIPLVIMTIVYIEIFIATRRRLRERARASRVNQHQITNNNLTNINISNNNNNNNKNNNSKNNNNRNKKKSKLIGLGNNESNLSELHDQESISSETNHNDNHHHHHHLHNNNDVRSIEIPQYTEKSRKKDVRKKTKDSIKAAHKKYNENLLRAIVAEDSITDIPNDDDDEYDEEYDNEELIGKKCNNNNSNDCILADDKMITSFDASACADKLDDIKFIDNINCTTTILASTINQQIPSVTTTPTTTTSHTTSSATPKQMHTSQTASAHSTIPLTNTKKSNNVYQFIEEKQKISLSKERRAARTLGIIMGVFILCWVPFFLLYIIVPFCPTCCPSDLLIDFLTWLGYINSALNPIIYTIFNLEYRRAFKKLLGIKF